MVKLKESFEEKEPAYSGRTKCTRLLRVCPYLLNPYPFEDGGFFVGGRNTSLFGVERERN